MTEPSGGTIGGEKGGRGESLACWIGYTVAEIPR